METESVVRETSVPAESKESSYFKVTIDLFFSPTKAFQSLRSKPRWALPFFLCFIVSFLMLTAHDNPSWDKYKMIIDFLTLKQLLIAFAFVIVSLASKVFGTAFFLWLGLQLYPVKIKYSKILSIVSFAFLVMIPEAIIKLPLIFAKESTDVFLGPASLLPTAWHESPLYNVLVELDVFTIWLVVLIAIGIPLVTKISKRQSMITVGYLYGIWLLLSMFSGNFINLT